MARADLHVLGGIAPVVRLLAGDSPQVVALAAYVLGTAASNNPTFQRHLLAAHADIFESLIQVRMFACTCMCRSVHVHACMCTYRTISWSPRTPLEA